MMVEKMKTLRGESGDTFIRSSDDWGNRAAFTGWTCLWFFFGEQVFSSASFVQIVRDTGPFAPTPWVFFLLWIIVFALICVRILWSFFGATKISVSSDKLDVRCCIFDEAIFIWDSIELSTIKNIFIEEREFYFKNSRWRRWLLIVYLKDGSKQLLAQFPNELDANEFMSRCVE